MSAQPRQREKLEAEIAEITNVIADLDGRAERAHAEAKWLDVKAGCKRDLRNRLREQLAELDRADNAVQS